MADKIKWSLTDIYYGRNAPSQANRTDYYPGTAGSKRGDEIWQDFSIPVGNKKLEKDGPADTTYERTTKPGHSIMNDVPRPVYEGGGYKHPVSEQTERGFYFNYKCLHTDISKFSTNCFK